MSGVQGSRCYLFLNMTVELTKIMLNRKERYISVLHTWGYSCKINLDSVILCRPDKKEHYVITVNSKGDVTLPDPRYYW